MRETVAELKAVHASALGEQLHEIETFEEVLDLLGEDDVELPAVVEWSDEGSQSVVLKTISEGAIHFFNPGQRAGSQPKTVVVEGGPLRTVVGSGVESLSVEAFRELSEGQRLICFVARRSEDSNT